jgi:predicted HTH domain antitoxin
MAVDKLEIPKEMKERIEEIMRYEPLDESLIVLQALRYGLVEMKKELAIRLFSEERVTISEAAKLAEKSVGEMMEVLSRRGIKSKITLEDFGEGLENALELVE